MNARRFCTFVVFAFGLAALGCKSEEQKQAEKAAQKAEIDKLQGKWKIVSRDADAEGDEEDAVAPSAYFVIEGDVMKLVFKDSAGAEQGVSYYKIALVAPDKDPKQFDLTYTDEKGTALTATTVKKGKKKKTRTTLKDAGIYKIEGDKLTMSLSWDEKKRPTDFTSGKGSGRYVLTLEKIKEEPKAAPKDDSKPKIDATPANVPVEIAPKAKTEETPPKATKKED